MSPYLCPLYVIYDNRIEFKLHFMALCKSYQLKCKPTSVKNQQVNAILEQMNGVLADMMQMTGLNMSETVGADAVDKFITNAAWPIHATHNTVLQTKCIWITIMPSTKSHIDIDGVLCKTEDKNISPWTITQVHCNGAVRIQCCTMSGQVNIKRC